MLEAGSSTRALARLIGAPIAEVAVLVEAFARDARRRRTSQAPSGLPAHALDLLLGMYLLLSGIAVASLAWRLAATPPAAALLLSSLHLVFLQALLVGELYGVLLADEGYQVIATWPVRSASFFLARLLSTTRRALAITLLLMTPSLLVLVARAPMYTLAWLGFFGASIAAAILATWAVAALYALLLAPLGAPRLRLLGVLFQAIGMIGPLLGGVLLGKRIELVTALLREPPLSWPSAWVSATVELFSNLPLPGMWARLGVGCLVAVLLPVVALRGGAHVYARGLASARLQATRSPVLTWASRIARAQRRSALRAVATLLVAHARGDWRFRAQVLLVPTMGLFGVVGALLGLDLRKLFADPLVRDGWMHPAMVFVALAMVLPMLAVPVMIRSSDHEAAWILRSATLGELELERAARTLLRVLFVLPVLLVTVAGYGLSGIAWTSIVAHAVTLALLAELALRGAQSLIHGLPFSRPPDDEEIERAVAALLMLAWSICLLAAGLVVQLVYRHWLAIVGFDLYLLLLLRGVSQRGRRA